MERHHGDFSSGSSILGKIRPGIFQAQYGAHGLEMVHFKDGQGVKITGDPNVPFNAITFRVTDKNRVDFPPEIQSCVRQLQANTEDFKQHSVEDCAELKYKFKLPAYMEVEGELPRDPREYLGRWPAEGHVAGHGFSNDYFVPANLIFFNEDKFGVIFIEFNSIAVYSRIEI